LGCPIDLDRDANGDDPGRPQGRGLGWMLDDQRPTLALATPRRGKNSPLDRILVGMYDADTGLDMESFRVVSDVALAGIPAGENLADEFRTVAPGVWEWRLGQAIEQISTARLSVSVRDRQGNTTRIERRFSIEK
jgi:hypothetical protein